MKRSSNSRVWKPARTRMAIWLSSMLVALQRLDLLADRARLLVAVPHAAQRDALAFLHLGPQRLAEPALVVGDQVRGGGQDVRRRAVVALQPDDGGAGEILLEAQDVADLRAAPAVDRLVVVADAADVLRCPAPAGAATDTARRWCPGTRRPGCGGSGADTAPARRDAAATASRSAARRSPKSTAFTSASRCLVLAVDLDRLAVGELAGILGRHLVGRERAVLPALDDRRTARGPAISCRRCPRPAAAA